MVFQHGVGRRASELLTRFAVKTRIYYAQLFPAAQRDLQTLQTAGTRKAKSVELAAFLLRTSEQLLTHTIATPVYIYYVYIHHVIPV